MFLDEKKVVIISCSLCVPFNRNDVQFSLSHSESELPSCSDSVSSMHRNCNHLIEVKNICFTFRINYRLRSASDILCGHG